MLTLTLIAVLVLPCLAVLPSEVLELSNAISLFSQKLYQEIAKNKPLAIYSPLSAHTCLSMVLLGARGDTAEEMAATLQVTNMTDPHSAYNQLIQDLNSVQDVELLKANGLFFNPASTILPEYQSAIVSKYDAVSQALDFNAAGGPEALINSWVANNTDNKITDILQPGVINTDTQLVLVNTIFFNATWSSMFQVNKTSKKDFTKPDGSTVPVDMMNQVSGYQIKLSALNNIDVLRMSFANPRFAFYIALPKSKPDLDEMEKALSSNDTAVDSLFNDLTDKQVELFLPKFALSASMNLKAALSQMGMPTAFSNAANFSGITDTPSKISALLQKAVIEVQESGTVAAAATAAVLVPVSAVQPGDVVTFNVDRPFVFFIRDDQTKVLLFQGKLEDPAIGAINIP
ncbi:serpin B6-like [Physella acuta]|uniref:serpin B6-like n=1 Tax=Physella acuta TaxID=109671 RepID=UPI0027DC490D|nr:serpin B6-like [Physella acuta]